VVRIALLAPFEGRYREVGYNALYAARLALLDSGLNNVELLPIDDGGAVESAESRARALNLNPQTQIALVVGYSASSERVQGAFGDVPVILVGNWSAQPVVDTAFALSSPRHAELMTVPPDVSVTEAARLEAPLVGGEVFALAQFPKLRDSLDSITIVSSASLPDTAFRERYQALDSFAPEPGLLGTLTYDAASMAAQAVEGRLSRRECVRRWLP
jgi:ABC-type branched-subunit amino acid transport system substrate-binding protein